MVAFDKDKARFNFRVAGVAIHNGRVLLDRNSRNAYWVFPGGHPDMMETMTDALRREIQEEIGADVKVKRLLWVMENFFHRNKDIHELSFYFMMEIDPYSDLLKSDGPFFGMEHNHRLTFQWFPIEEQVLSGLPLYPSTLASALLNLPESPQHIIFNDAISAREEIPKSQEISKSSTQRLTIS
jgi:8-oxo-dGTP pyrophosphatase MutT (NUDIX family)